MEKYFATFGKKYLQKTTHTPYERLKNDTEAVIMEHKLWNCKYIGLGSMPMEYRGSKEGFLAFARESNQIAKRIYDAGLQFAYHNHNFEFEKFDGITGMEILLNETDPEAFGFIIDTYWVQAGGANPVEWIRKVAGRMGVVHLKDMAIINSQQAFAEIGQGNLNWASIIKACRDTGVSWYAVEQDICLRDPFESLKISLEYLMNYI
jgi:sugar phosphate isomerase/epimerase